jgi:hypothetical protein
MNNNEEYTFSAIEAFIQQLQPILLPEVGSPKFVYDIFSY